MVSPSRLPNRSNDDDGDRLVLPGLELELAGPSDDVERPTKPEITRAARRAEASARKCARIHEMHRLASSRRQAAMTRQTGPERFLAQEPPSVLARAAATPPAAVAPPILFRSGSGSPLRAAASSGILTSTPSQQRLALAQPFGCSSGGEQATALAPAAADAAAGIRAALMRNSEPLSAHEQSAPAALVPLSMRDLHCRYPTRAGLAPRPPPPSPPTRKHKKVDDLAGYRVADLLSPPPATAVARRPEQRLLAELSRPLDHKV